MPLNPVQVLFVREVARPTIERLIRLKSELDAFVLDFDNQWTPIPTSAVALDDNDTGTAPRADAPALTGAQVTQLRGFCANMSGQISGPALNTLVQVAVRSVESILRS